MADQDEVYGEWLEREDWDIDWSDMDDPAIRNKLDELFGKEGREASGKQVDALTDAIKHNQELQKPILEPLKPDYYRHMGGKQYPRLASRGIKRLTYTRAGISLTRYQVPGRQGLFSLGSAREIFGNL